jgi:polyphenol oxidase
MTSNTFKSFSQFSNIKHGISTKEFGTMKNENGDIDRLNLSGFLGALSMSNSGVCMQQVHGRNIKIVENDRDLYVKETDGLITQKKNIPLCVATADCLPILFYDKVNNVIGIAHGGRKGLDAGIIKQMIEQFVNNYNSDPKDIIVGIGPGIERKCYWVESKFIDIRALAIDDLIKSGIEEKNIENIDLCTKCNKDKFYSYRGGDKNDRIISAISII